MRRFAKVFEFEADQVLVRLDTDEHDELVIILTLWVDDSLHNMSIKPLDENRSYDGEITYQLFQTFSEEQVLEALEFFGIELWTKSPTES